MITGTTFFSYAGLRSSFVGDRLLIPSGILNSSGTGMIAAEMLDIFKSKLPEINLDLAQFGVFEAAIVKRDHLYSAAAEVAEKILPVIHLVAEQIESGELLWVLADPAKPYGEQLSEHQSVCADLRSLKDFAVLAGRQCFEIDDAAVAITGDGNAPLFTEHVAHHSSRALALASQILLATVDRIEIRAEKHSDDIGTEHVDYVESEVISDLFHQISLAQIRLMEACLKDYLGHFRGN